MALQTSTAASRIQERTQSYVHICNELVLAGVGRHAVGGAVCGM